MASAPAIRTHGLRKEYGRTVAVAGVDLEVEPGQVVGLLGPNGAGKTTLIKMLLGLVRPTAGEAFVLGRPVSDWRVRGRIGFLPEHFRFQDWLTGWEFLEAHGRLYGLPAQERRERAQELLEMLGLARHAERPLREFSKGMLQRVGLAQALLCRPELVFLDEPTSGLDPLGRLLVRDVLRQLRAGGTTVFLNSHLLSEVELTCDWVAFMRRGQLVRAGPLAQLLSGAVEVQVRAQPREPETQIDWGEFGDAWPQGDGGWRLRLASEEQVPDVVEKLVAQGVRVYAVEPRRLSLEELFLQVMEGEEAG